MSEVGDISDERLAELHLYWTTMPRYQIWQEIQSVLAELQRRREHDRYGQMEE